MDARGVKEMVTEPLGGQWRLEDLSDRNGYGWLSVARPVDGNASQEIGNRCNPFGGTVG